MSDRDAQPTTGQDVLKNFRARTDGAIQTLEQRPTGSPNGLIVPGGAAGTWVPLSGYAGTWGPTAQPDKVTPAYCMDADGFVHLRGHVTNTVSWPGGAILAAGGLLPVGYRPSKIESFVGSGIGSATPVFAMWQVLPTGGIDFDGVTGGAWAATNYLSLSGILFYAGSQ